MQENLKQEKRTKALSIIAICLLLVLFTASIFLAVIAPVFSSNGVASADSSFGSVGSVNYNLFTNPKFDKQGDNVFAFQNKFAQDVVYADGTTLSYVSSNGGFVVSTTTAAGENHWVGFLFKPSNIGTYTFTINSDIVGRPGYKFRLRDTKYTTYVDSDSANFNDYISITYNITDLSKDYFLQFLMPASDVSASIYWLKIELGSSFTGYVPDFQNTIEDLQNELDSQKDTVANYKFSQRFLTTINMPSRRLFINMSRLPKFSSKGFITNTFNSYSSLDYFAFTTESSDNVWSSGLIGEVSTLGWKLNYRGNNFTTAELCIGDKVIFSYDVSGTLTGRGPTGSYPVASDIDNAVVSNPKWYIASNMEYAGIKIYNYDFSGDASYWYLYTKVSFGGGAVEPNVLLDEMYTGSAWCYSFALNDTNNWVDLDNDVYYDLGYKSGVDNGYSGGYSDGQNKGYKEGFSAGKDNGYNIGYSEGVAAGQDYSFSALFGAVFDVPIQAFKGLFNFEIFGVNMTSFVSSLLALCVIVVIVKICLGGK